MPGSYLLFSKGCQKKIASASMSAAHFPHIRKVPFLHLRPKPFPCKDVAGYENPLLRLLMLSAARLVALV